MTSSLSALNRVLVAGAGCAARTDLPVLGTAVAGRADVLITVDKDLLELKAHCGIPIIRPGEFRRRIEPNSSSPGAATPSDEQDTPTGQRPSES